MPLFADEADEAKLSAEARPSAVLELLWLLGLTRKPLHVGGRASGDALRAAAPDVRAEMAELWGADWIALPDLPVLAERLGVLLDDDAAPFLDGMDRAARSDGVALDLQSESPADRAATLERLERLRTDPGLLGRYRDLLARMWGLVAAEWESAGRAAVHRACRTWDERLRDGATPASLVPGCQWFDRGAMGRLIAARGRVVLTPLYFCERRGGFVTDMTTYLHLGGPIEPVDPERLRREESEQVADRLKVLADGTRVAILREMAREPSSVVQLARRFGLAQPTVSNHVRLLQHAGLLESRREGARVLYRAPRDRLDQLIGDARHILLEH